MVDCSPTSRNASPNNLNIPLQHHHILLKITKTVYGEGDENLDMK